MTANQMVLSSLRIRPTKLVLLGVSLLCVCATLRGNDSAAEVAAGGIQLRKEARISMEKERLTISSRKVTVEYEFLNTTDHDIATEVAFPTPPYEYTFGEGWYGAYKLSEFRLWVDETEKPYEVDSRAFLRGRDFTNELRALDIDIATFGRLDSLRSPGLPPEQSPNSQIEKLSKQAKDHLVSLGLLDKQYGNPTWTVFRTYHWRQLFPARKMVRVKHEYEPVFGYQPIDPLKIKKELKDVCLDPNMEKRLLAFRAKKLANETMYSEDYVPVGTEWVKYILTTANTWKTPIKNFELIVEDSQVDRQHEYIGASVCWDGQVERLDKTHMIARKANFVPAHELTVYYFSDF